VCDERAERTGWEWEGGDVVVDMNNTVVSSRVYTYIYI
jgi:hypothetical protein